MCEDILQGKTSEESSGGIEKGWLFSQATWGTQFIWGFTSKQLYHSHVVLEGLQIIKTYLANSMLYPIQISWV